MSAGAENINYKELYEATLQINQQLLAQLAQLQGQLHTLTKLLKGFKSERFIPASVAAEQPSLDLLFEEAAEATRLADVQKKIIFTTTKPEGPDHMLRSFRGHLQVDGYGVYDHFDTWEHIIVMYCMAHARRYFFDALSNDAARAEYALTAIKKLYDIEAYCKEQSLPVDQVREKRQTEAVPILGELGKWMQEQYIQVPPKSTIGVAMAYSIKRWEKLSLYTTEGKLQIDNNCVERSVRPVSIGRKNFLFCGSHEAAKRTALLYSLLVTCKLNNVNPYDWLKDVLTRIAAHPISKIAELLPHNWKAINTAKIAANTIA